MITLEKAVYVFQSWDYKLDYSFVRGGGHFDHEREGVAVV
jgi:hypothetical protein